MINIYPSNRLENLVALFDKVIQMGENKNILSSEIILVQSKGMQHWLNMQLANKRGVSMNLDFSLPMQFFWTQIRYILGKDEVPEHSAYTREVLSWRIHALLASDEMINNPLCAEATEYWLATNDVNKRFQLACQLADLFEQYQIFRPDWILEWEKEQAPHWQALLWKLLIKQQPNHPVYLLQKAIKKLQQQQCYLPERINLFGINTLPPLWLDFLSELGEHTQVHFFHLNPCIEYWGDLKTDKINAKQYFYRWLNHENIDEDDLQTSLLFPPLLNNPLLSNLGSQGKDFLYLLQDHCRIEIPFYSAGEEIEKKDSHQQSILESIQDDILKLYDARIAPTKKWDSSLVISSAHSALREIQALHDWLLHQINDDSHLDPKDILVMCPNVEDYAPYIEAVFAHGWHDVSEKVPPLPCSIADRSLKDSEPLVQAFIELLKLPDSRFQASQIFTYLRLPAIQQQFGFAIDDLEQIELWVNHAAIHWGLDEAHKQKILSTEQSNPKFTWLDGLNRLLLGFAYEDDDVIYQHKLLLADVEGEQAILLGRFMELLEQLQFYCLALQKPRDALQWQIFLYAAKDKLFAPLAEDNNAQQVIEQAIDNLGEFTHQANYQEKIPLHIVADFLLSHFSQPEPSRQFMAGKVTFCSMMPMRSVPFRVIAVLGLNEGEFPRQRIPMGFDLMAKASPRQGDRSRRADDRYLFLEALISCRDKLYLSYQGVDIKTNNQRQPSLVLQELMAYLEQAYGWQLSSGEKLRVAHVPLQAFSNANYKSPFYSFNQNWLKLNHSGDKQNNWKKVDIASITHSLDEVNEVTLTAEELVQFFDNPCQVFAQQQLGLYLDKNSLNGRDLLNIEDNEPFETTHLDRYLIQDELIRARLFADASDEDIKQLLQKIELSGLYPDTPMMQEDLQLWQQQADEFAGLIKTKVNKVEKETIDLQIAGVNLQAQLPWFVDKEPNTKEHENQLVFWRLASPKGKDDIRLWIHHLIAQVYSQKNETNSSIVTQGFFRGEKQEAVQNIKISDVIDANNLLSELIICWKEGMQQPLLLNANLGQKHCALGHQGLDNKAFYALWQDDFQTQGLGSNAYIKWFWADKNEKIPQWEGLWQERIEQIYQPLYHYYQRESYHW